jgi:NO-binding membrane sensor protein with MHYT domain
VTFVYNAVLFLHFIGMAMLVGGFLAQMRAEPRQVTQWMRDGALTQLITGLALAGMAGSKVGTEAVFNPASIATKLVIALVVTAICLYGMRQEPAKQQPFWAAAGGLAIVNVIVAVFWVTATATG